MSGGNADQYRWWMPKMYARQNPAMLTYFGLGGKMNRAKLAEQFKRPTNWSTYCNAVSLDACKTADGIAARAPENDMEAGHYFVPGLYAGHFRATDENNCTANPDTCTGHITNVRCSWGNYAVQQAYHLNISAESGGNLSPNGGYGYSLLLEIYEAANATRSNVLMVVRQRELLSVHVR